MADGLLMWYVGDGTRPTLGQAELGACGCGGDGAATYRWSAEAGLSAPADYRESLCRFGRELIYGGHPVDRVICLSVGPCVYLCLSVGWEDK